MALTYEPIATYTAGSAIANLTFSTIPNTYTDLVISISAISGTTNNPTITVTFNGDGSTSYSGTQFYYRGTGTGGANKNINQEYMAIGRSTGLHPSVGGMSMITMNIFNYANTSNYKTFLAQTGNESTGIEFDVANWRSSAAITSITLNAGSGGWDTGTVYTIYGIKAA